MGIVTSNCSRGRLESNEKVGSSHANCFWSNIELSSFETGFKIMVGLLL